MRSFAIILHYSKAAPRNKGHGIESILIKDFNPNTIESFYKGEVARYGATMYSPKNVEDQLHQDTIFVDSSMQVDVDTKRSELMNKSLFLIRVRVSSRSNREFARARHYAHNNT